MKTAQKHTKVMHIIVTFVSIAYFRKTPKKKDMDSGKCTEMPQKPLPNTSVPKQFPALRDRIEATLYGNCIGDAIGLLTEFMNKPEAWHVSVDSYLNSSFPGN